MSDALIDLFWPLLEPSLERNQTPKIVTIKVVFPLLSALILVSDGMLLSQMSQMTCHLGFFNLRYRLEVVSLHLFEGVGCASCYGIVCEHVASFGACLL